MEIVQDDKPCIVLGKYKSQSGTSLKSYPNYCSTIFYGISNWKKKMISLRIRLSASARQYGRSKKCPSLIITAVTLVTIITVHALQNIIMSKGSTLRVLILEDQLEMKLFINL